LLCATTLAKQQPQSCTPDKMDFLKDMSIDKLRNAAEDAYNQNKPKSDVESRVYEVLSHKNWGASSTLLNDIAKDTYDYDKYTTVTRLMWEGMDNRPAAWRVVFKALTLLEHLVKNGSERCVDDARNHSHKLRSLNNFNYYEGTVDRGIGVKEKAKQIIEMLSDNDQIREEREKAKNLRDKFGGNRNTGGEQYGGYGGSSGSGGGYSGGGGGGYGDSGIGSSTMRGKDESGYSGRYGNSKSFANKPKDEGAVPTFATLPEKKKSSKKNSGSKPTKVKKLKKKAKEVKEAKSDVTFPTPAPPTPEVDLFAFDDTPVSAPAPVVSNDDFGPLAGAASAKQATSFDAFGIQNNSQKTQQPDPFAVKSEPNPVQSFNAFGNFPQQAATPAQPSNVQTQPVQSFDAFGSFSQPVTTPTQPTSATGMGMAFGNSMLPTQAINAGNGANNVMSSGSAPAASGPSGDDDDDGFGDFSGVEKVKTSDPLAGLISLDSLSKNTKKADPLSQPVVYNQAAASALANPRMQGGGMSQISKEISFGGIDGLNKNNTVPSNFNTSVMNTGNTPGVNAAGMMGSGMMGSQGAPKMNSQPGQQMGGMMGMANPQMMMMQNGMTPQMIAMMQQQMQQQMMQQQMMQNNAMMANTQNSTMNPNMMGGGMMGNPMMAAQGGMMQTPQMMGGQGTASFGVQGGMGGMGGLNSQMMGMMGQEEKKK